MEAGVVEDRVSGVAETNVTGVATVADGAATRADEVESMGGKPRMEATWDVGKADWVLDTLEFC